jgi:predicted nucleic acid-binding protein
MIAFFDSNVHIRLLLGALSLESIVEEIGSMPVRLSPVVASELLRGVSGQAQRSVEKLINQLLPVEPHLGNDVGTEGGSGL